MTTTTESRLDRTYRDAFWSAGQRQAFEAACAEAGVVPSRREALRWKHAEGEAYAAWRGLSKSERRRRLDD